MSYTVIQILFLIGTLMFLTGFFMNLAGRTDGFSNIGADVASAIALIVVYAVLIVSVDNGVAFVEKICDGIPFIDEIKEFGSLKNTYINAPDKFARAFFDMVLLAMVTDVIKKFFGVSGMLGLIFKRKATMSLLLTYVVASLIGVGIFNYIIKTSELYASVANALGAISAFSAFAIAVLLFVFRKPAGFIGPIADFFMGSLFKAILYVAIILFMETFLVGFDGGINFVLDILVAFGPVLVMGIGFAVLFKSVKF